MRPKRKPEVETSHIWCEVQHEASHFVWFLCWWAGLLMISAAAFLILGGAALFLPPFTMHGGEIAVVILICAVGAAIGSDRFP